MSTMPPAIDTDRRALGPAWHRRVAGLHVLKVKGSFYEMGRQHGELLRDDVPVGPLPYFRTYVERLMGQSNLGPLAPLVWPAVQKLVGGRVAKAMPGFALETLRGVADGAGMPFDQVLAGSSMPDALLWVASRVMQLTRVGPAVHHRVALGLGCTSAIAWGAATADGRLLHARNFDYHGVESWTRTAAVIFHEPDQGLRYVSVAAAGVPMGGVTAMNEAGLTLTVHQHMFTDRAALGGTPIGLVGDVVMREARSLDDAERVLARYTPIGCWTYLIADAKTNQVLCWEENPQRRAVRRTDASETTFGYANVYLDPELGATEMNLYGSYWRHNQGRHARSNALLAAGHGRLDVPAMAAILGDTGDTDCRLRSAIAMLMTVGSVVFRPEDGALWVGSGQSPTSHRPFVPFSLSAEDHLPELGTIAGAREQDTTALEAFDHYREAYLAQIDRDEPQECMRLLTRCCELAPEQPLYHSVRGIVALSLLDAVTAEAALTRALAISHPDPERLASFHLWRGRARDLLSRRDEAEWDYRRALGHHADPPVREAAQKGLRRPFARRACSAIHMDFAHADVVQP